jgi:hypothetical protein
LGLSDLRGGHQSSHEVPFLSSITKPLCRRKVEPEMGLHIVLWNAQAFSVHQPKVKLRFLHALLSSPTEPFDGLSVIFGNALASGIPRPQHGLRFCVSPLG